MGVTAAGDQTKDEIIRWGCYIIKMEIFFLEMGDDGDARRRAKMLKNADDKEDGCLFHVQSAMDSR